MTVLAIFEAGQFQMSGQFQIVCFQTTCYQAALTGMGNNG